MVDMRRDGGARFRKCDLQVHTPRDRNWEGEFQNVQTNEERQEYAKAFVADCRRKGLNAVAITDHHDICLFRWVRDAAIAETSSEGAPLPEEKRLVVFPGMELTLSEPSFQALLILDPDLPDRVLDLIPTALGISMSDASDVHHAPVTPLSARNHLQGITDALDEIVINPDETNPNNRESLSGRFILLPHVSNNGHQTLLRRGFNATYSRMPCVGGYIERRSYAELGEGEQRILEGDDLHWGNKAIGVFATSDCRSARYEAGGDDACIDFRDLGRWPTWIKWTEPSAEALRQACLAKESRMSQTQPELPVNRIVSVHVTGATFMEDDNLVLNPQYNAFIGGRGTGKSSLLEYLRWALCDSPVPSELVDTTEHELPDYQKRRVSLISKTLSGGQVTVVYEKNSVRYTIKRQAAERIEKVLVTSESGASQIKLGEEVRREFPIQSYAQKQLSCVGTLPEEIKRLVEGPVQPEVSAITEEIEQVLLPLLRELRQRELRLKELDSSVADVESRVASRREQIKALQNELTGLSEEEQAVIAQHDSVVKEERFVADLRQVLARVDVLIDTISQKLSAIELPVVGDASPNAEFLTEVSVVISDAISKAVCQLNGIRETAGTQGELAEKIRGDLDKVEITHTQHNEKYAICLEKTESSKQKLDRIQALDKELAQMLQQQSRIRAEAENLRDGLETEMKSAWDQWVSKHRERSEILREQCNTISQQAEYTFRATLSACGSLKSLCDGLSQLVSEGAYIQNRSNKVLALAKLVLDEDDRIARWNDVIAEFDLLVGLEESAPLPDTPLLIKAGFSEANRQAIAIGLSRDVLEDVRFTPLSDDVIFEFAFGREPDGTRRYIPFLDASPGQQATVLMKTLLGEEGAPLLIDQPEEDLDNVQIREVADDVCKTKKNRQLIFISHNANIVVNGDAELVVHFNYADPNDRTRGIIERTGSIDYGPIRETITSVMEGGREAFDLRKQKYGF